MSGPGGSRTDAERAMRDRDRYGAFYAADRLGARLARRFLQAATTEEERARYRAAWAWRVQLAWDHRRRVRQRRNQSARTP